MEKSSEKGNSQGEKSPKQTKNLKLNNSFMRLTKNTSTPAKSHRAQQRVETFEAVMERLSKNIKISPSKRKNRYIEK